MFSQLAKEDLDDLRAEGLVPTDEDIIRLHALAARITDRGETTAWNAPRFAVAGGTVFWEPTMAAWYWIDTMKRFAEDAATEDWMFGFACANGRRPGYLSALTDPREIEGRLGLFVADFTGTKNELDRAVLYVTAGEYVRPEKTELAKLRERAQTADGRERAGMASLEELLCAAAAATGLGYEDILAQTPSRLCGMIYAAHVQADMEMTASSAKAHADYLATLNAVAARLRGEKTGAGETVAAKRDP